MNTRFPSVLSLHPWLQPSLSSVLFILSLACASPGLAACGGASGADRVRVEYVYDGDTVRLDDGRKLRLIGVNTPEASSSSRAGEPYSRRARAFLAARIEEAGNRLHILPDQQKQDRYKRDLVHLFLPDGRNLSELLLRAGLGFFVVVPPNTLFAGNCSPLLPLPPGSSAPTAMIA